jgi:hypothetical protein
MTLKPTFRMPAQRAADKGYSFSRIPHFRISLTTRYLPNFWTISIVDGHDWSLSHSKIRGIRK